MRKWTYVLATLMVVVFLSSCATVKSVPRPRAVERLMELVNSGDSEMVSSLTNNPMIVDGEIVQRETDIQNFWDLVAKARFAVNTGEDYYSEKVGPETYLIFGDTMEVRTFFDKYVPKTAVTVTVDGKAGQYVFLLSGRKGRYPYIFGFTGPVE